MTANWNHDFNKLEITNHNQNEDSQQGPCSSSRSPKQGWHPPGTKKIQHFQCIISGKPCLSLMFCQLLKEHQGLAICQPTGNWYFPTINTSI